MIPPLPTTFRASRERPASWHNARRGHVGASEVAGILGLDTNNTAHTLWLLKTGRARPEGTNEAMDWGTRTEAIIARRWAKCYMGGLGIRKWQRAVGAGHLRATPDYEPHGIYLPCLIQIKTASAFADGWGKRNTDEIPLTYVAQVQAEMACVPWAQWVYVVVQRGSATVTYVVERNEELIAIIRAAVEWFWGYVERDEDPIFDQYRPGVREGRIPDRVDLKTAPELVGVEACLAALRGFPVSLTVNRPVSGCSIPTINEASTRK